MTDEFVPVTRYSRCKRYSGATLKCPHCGELKTVYHLAWYATTCHNCQRLVDKTDFLIKK